MRVEPVTCPGCGEKYDPLRARAVAVRDGRVRAFCSTECKARADRAESGPVPLLLQPDPSPAPGEERAPFGLGSMAGVLLLAVAGGAALALGGKLLDRSPGLSAVVRTAGLAPSGALAAVAPRPLTGTEALSLLEPSPKGSGKDDDTWYHPLPGPDRRLPIRNTRRFGAAREGLRPEECREGHCGVDLGNQRGDVVVCSHDGVIERVAREDDGKEGRFVRVNHKGGTVVTSYMHLDRIEEALRPGLPVKAGDVLGTVGETGVQHSGPHLHFAVSVRPSIDGPELFIDPEPLLHLWPLRAPVEPPPPRRARRSRVAAASTPGKAGGSSDDPAPASAAQ